MTIEQEEAGQKPLNEAEEDQDTANPAVDEESEAIELPLEPGDANSQPGA